MPDGALRVALVTMLGLSGIQLGNLPQQNLVLAFRAGLGLPRYDKGHP